MSIKVKLYDEGDRWRYVCPRGHRSWEPTNHHFWCKSCARQPDTEAVFDKLHDRENGEELERDEVTLLTPVGPYSDGGHA